MLPVHMYIFLLFAFCVNFPFVLSSPHTNHEATVAKTDRMMNPHLLQPGRVGNDPEAFAPLDLRLQTWHFLQHIRFTIVKANSFPWQWRNELVSDSTSRTTSPSHSSSD